MRALRAAFSRFRGLFGKSRTDREWEEEIQAHLQMHIDDKLRAGMDPEQARREALLKFGGLQPATEAYRDRRGLPWLETLIQDLRYAARTLRKEPGFTAVVVLTLALGVGANTAMFSLIDAVLWKLLPVQHPEQLFYIYTTSTRIGNIRLSRTLLNRDVAAMQHATSIAGLSSYATAPRLNVGMNGRSELVSGHFIGGTYFDVLGVQPVLGRAIQPSDEHAGGRVAMLGYGYWQRRFGADPAVLGKTITVSKVPFTIIGVTPLEFYGLDADTRADVLLPYATMKQVDRGGMSSEEPKPDDGPGQVFARLKDGVSRPSAEAELAIFFHQVEGAAGGSKQLDTLDKLSLDLQPASRALSSVRNRFSQPLLVLMVVVALVMLIACSNIANLLLAKSAARRREIAIRLSLGSTRRRLVRQLLTESLLLSLCGGVLGLLFAVWLRDAVVYLASTPDTVPVIPAEWNIRVLGFTAAVCILNALLFGLAPALRATGVDLASMLKGAFRIGRAAQFPLGKILVVGQVALSLALLSGAALFLGTFRNLDRVDPGFDRNDVLMVTLDPTMAGYNGQQAREIFRTAVQRVLRLPGVRAATLMRDRMLVGHVSLTSIWVPGYTLREDENASNQWVFSNAVGPRFFAIAGVRLIAGRDFSARDDLSAPKIAIINQTMANHYFAGQNPIGQKIAWSRTDPPVEIVGIVRDTAYMGLRDQKQDVVFTPILQDENDSWHAATIFMRTAADSPRIAQDVRAALQALHPNLPPFAVRTMNQQVANALVQQRLLATLTSFFGLVALALSAIGLYGVVSYGVSRRTSEIGVRIALGASRLSILHLTLGETGRMAGLGLVLGLGLALLGGRLVESLLYGVTPFDPASLALSIAVLAAVALLAGFLPARRASRVEPMSALRYE